MREVYIDSNAEAPEDEGPSTAVGYILETGDAQEIIDLLREMLVATGMTVAALDADLEARAKQYLADQTEQWWEH